MDDTPSAEGPHGNHLALVRTTVESEEDAKRLAGALIGDRQAACVHIHAIRSWYEWEGAVEEAGEWLVEARVPQDGVDEAWAAILDAHPYDLPMVEVVEDVKTTAKYAAWARSVTTPRDP